MFLLTPPVLDIPTYDPRPTLELIQRGPEADLSAQMRATRDKLAADVGSIRRQAGMQYHLLLAALLGAENRGERYDLSVVLKTIDDKIKLERAAISPLKTSLAKLVRTAQAGKLRGANTIGSYASEIDNILESWLDDIKDVREEVQAVARRSSLIGAELPGDRAIREYRVAVRDVFGIEPTVESDMNPEVGGPFIRMTIELPESVESDTDHLMGLEDQVHSRVSDKSPELVGAVALSYRSSVQS